MEWRLYSDDGQIRTYIKFEDGKMHVRKTQKVQKTLDLNHAQASEFQGYTKDTYTPIARVPLAVHRDWINKGLIDPKGKDKDAVFKLLNDGDYRKLRVDGGGQV